MEGSFLWRKFQSLIAIVVITIALCASTGWSSNVHVYMTNLLGKDAILYLHCAQNGWEMGRQEVPDHWTCQWKFPEYEDPPNELFCGASVPGAIELPFLAYDMTTDTCIDDCHWNFTSKGVFKYENGAWNLRYTWPH